MREEIKEKLKKMKLLMLDFDGVLTDNRVLVSEDGKELVFCHRRDGFGIEMLKKKGIEVVVISKEKNLVVQARCSKLGIKCWQGIDKKKDILLREIEKRSLVPENVCHVGNDINDLECIEIVGLGVAVADLEKAVLEAADYIIKRKGGRGAVRELSSLILESKKQ